MRLIDADSLRDEFENDIELDRYWACETIDKWPTIDAAPVVHARWIYHDSENGTVFTCGECKYTPEIVSEDTPYCPYCGAKMDLKEE